MFHFKLHAKFLVLVLGGLLIFLGILSYILVQREASILAQKSDEKQHVLAAAIMADLRSSMLTGTPRKTLDLMNSIRGTYGLVKLDVLRRDGSRAFGIAGDRLTIPQVEKAFMTGEESSFEENGPIPSHTILHPLKNEKECLGCHRGRGKILGVLLISLSLEDAAREIRKSKKELTLALASLIMLIGAMLYFAIRKTVLQPLSLLHEGAERIGGGEYGHRVHLNTDDELQDLAFSLNDMAERIEKSHVDLENRIRERTKQLSDSINLREAILASMSSGVMLIGPEGTVELINQAGAHILKSSPPDMMHRPLAELMPAAAKILQSSIGPYQEIEAEARDGSRIPIGFSSAYCHVASGVREGIIIVFRDLTKIKALETEVINKERFAAMGRVVAGVAHEIRNPLFGISSIGQVFARELKTPAHQELAHALTAETKRLNQLVEELLVYGRPMKLTPGWCDLADLWEEVIALHRGEIESKGITIGRDFKVGRAKAYLDVNQIRQVFLNLLRNAIEAMPSGGEVAIRLLFEDRYLIFKISDTGTGVPAAHIGKVFDLFFTTKPRGTGLGLGICKKIVEDHGGTISLESREWDWIDGRKGTTVTVKLPYQKTADEHEILNTYPSNADCADISS